MRTNLGIKSYRRVKVQPKSNGIWGIMFLYYFLNHTLQRPNTTNTDWSKYRMLCHVLINSLASDNGSLFTLFPIIIIGKACHYISILCIVVYGAALTTENITMADKRGDDATSAVRSCHSLQSCWYNCNTSYLSHYRTTKTERRTKCFVMSFLLFFHTFRRIVFDLYFF